MSHFLVNLSTTNIDKVVLMLFSQHRCTCVDSTFLFNLILTLNNIGSPTLNQCNSINVVPTLFCQRWNNVGKYTSAQLSFSTKFQRWNNVGSMLLYLLMTSLQPFINYWTSVGLPKYPINKMIDLQGHLTVWPVFWGSRVISKRLF